MRSRWLAAAAAAVLVVAGAAVAVGRWEASRALEREVARIDAAYALVGRKVDAPSLSGYRYGTLTCLFYDVDGIAYAVTLCFDGAGRLVESTDRRGPTPLYASIVRSPQAAPVTVDERRLDQLLRRLGARPR